MALKDSKPSDRKSGAVVSGEPVASSKTGGETAVAVSAADNKPVGDQPTQDKPTPIPIQAEASKDSEYGMQADEDVNTASPAATAKPCDVTPPPTATTDDVGVAPTPPPTPPPQDKEPTQAKVDEPMVTVPPKQQSPTIGCVTDEDLIKLRQCEKKKV